MAAQSGHETHGDIIRRGVKKSNIPGTLTFLALRGADPFLQYQILHGLGREIILRLGLSAVPTSPAFVIGISALDCLGLPLPHLILLGMSIGSSFKQIYWLVFLSAEEFPPSSALSIGFFNSLINIINTFLFLSATTSSISQSTGPLPLQVIMGICFYSLGILLETTSEWQRKRFKDNPKSRGKVMKGGLWRWARHINYGGYALWRAGYCMTASGFTAGGLVGSVLVYDFLHRAVPSLNNYCGKRYGEQWAQFKRDVRWVILPGIY